MGDCGLNERAHEKRIYLGLRCVLHLQSEGKSEGNIKAFADNFESWEKVQRCVDARKRSQKTSKYTTLIQELPKVFKPDYGYHSACYSKFTWVKSKDIEISDSKAPVIFTRSNISLPNSDKSNANILPAICIFCGKTRKKHKQKWQSLSKCESYEIEVSIRRTAKGLDDTNPLTKVGDYEFGDGPDFAAMEVHNNNEPCKVDYVNRYKNLSRSKKKAEDPEIIAKKVSKKKTFSYIVKHVLNQ